MKGNKYMEISRTSTITTLTIPYESVYEIAPSSPNVRNTFTGGTVAIVGQRGFHSTPTFSVKLDATNNNQKNV